MTNFSGHTNAKSFVFPKMADGTTYANIRIHMHDQCFCCLTGWLCPSIYVLFNVFVTIYPVILNPQGLD